MSLNVVDNSNYGFTEGLTRAQALALPWTAKNTSVLNADNCTAAGVYITHLSGGNTNLPNASSSGVLLVMLGGDISPSSAITQVFFDVSNSKIYSRWKETNSWTSWAAFGA